ncbi:hypothetical protein [Pseudooceanicola onchidii]|uniref:hypothetical protein n=1 Tax=Pseudooceanicola onchidii TaxID=2562279 RepID=UPI0010AAC6F3|nr:hypothetical protein [Pseudooceanicola onchidii]
MSETPLVLFIDLKPDTRIDLKTAARAAIAWADTVESVGAFFDPAHPPTIDLVASEPGSQKLRGIIKSITDDPQALIRTAIVSSIIYIVDTGGRWGLEQVLEYMKGPDAPQEVVSLSEEERTQIAKDVAAALEARLGEAPARRVFAELSNDDDVTGVGVTSRTDGNRPSIVVSRGEFPPEVFIIDHEGTEKRTRVEEVDLVLFRPVLTTETDKRWGFTWPYGKIGATIKDHEFLTNMAEGKLGIEMAQGIVLTVLLEISEERRESVWSVKEYSVQKVVKIRPHEKQERMDLQ